MNLLTKGAKKEYYIFSFVNRLRNVNSEVHLDFVYLHLTKCKKKCPIDFVTSHIHECY